ncbi:ketosteroid isomerase-like protein [Bradyrhizobium elkanii]|uniref:YybH family protein n=1 Tax=Bradyrhizobium elkanii TaxID=29448 RepID=UPI0015C33FD0|nr:nuclear transport factor 2 family protein [Bradyrhizobium elkanii]NWL42589.1 nuclear transport factor 2 family protein [Bradyrhizobium elkanii]
MRISYVLCFLIAAFSAPALAADADLKQEVQKIGATYAENFDKQNAAGIAALYATGGMHVNPVGPTTDIANRYQGAFKAGFNHLAVTVDQVSPLGADMALGLGEYHITGKNQSGEPLDVTGRWTAVYVLEAGTRKIRMLTALPKAPPPKD